MNIIRGYSQKIDDQFILRVSTGSKDDLDRILELNITVHGEETRKYISDLFLEHPRREEVLWLYIEDINTNKIVSGLTLCPLEWIIEDITIPICEMGFVGTLEPYRGRGFIVKLNDLFKKAMDERNYVFSVIRGIPYYYRRLDYEFVFPLDDRIILLTNKVPDNEYGNLKIRRAQEQDLNLIQTLYDYYYKQFFIFNKFDREAFVYRFFKEKFNNNRLSTYIIEDTDQAVAYFSIGLSYDNLACTINVPRLTSQQMIKVLQFVKKIYENENNLEIQFHVNQDSEFGKFIISLGGIPIYRYGWQLNIPNLALFFQTIKPIIEKRIKNSIFRDLSRNLIISNYRENIELTFINGKLTEIRHYKGYPDENVSDLRIPGSILFKLLLSDKSMEELNYIMDDAIVKPSSKLLIDIIFPKKNSYPDTYY